MKAKLIGVPGSHPSRAAELMLRHKGIEYTRFDLPNMSHKYILPLMRYRASTVPVMKIDGRRVTTTRRIARALDALRPQPPLFPAADRATVEGAEAWADSVLQDGIRQLARWVAVHDRESMASFLDGAHMGVPSDLVKRALPAIRPVVVTRIRVPDETARACAQALPAQLDRVDALLAEGVIGGAQPNAADYQVATSVRLALCADQLRDHVAARPAGGHALRLCPDYPGRLRAVMPEEWVAWTT
jgi:glutathione S-transferase